MTRQDKAQRDVLRLQRGGVLKNLYRQYSENLFEEDKYKRRHLPELQGGERDVSG